MFSNQKDCFIFHVPFEKLSLLQLYKLKLLDFILVLVRRQSDGIMRLESMPEIGQKLSVTICCYSTMTHECKMNAKQDRELSGIFLPSYFVQLFKR